MLGMTFGYPVATVSDLPVEEDGTNARLVGGMYVYTRAKDGWVNRGLFRCPTVDLVADYKHNNFRSFRKALAELSPQAAGQLIQIIGEHLEKHNQRYPS